MKFDYKQLHYNEELGSEPWVVKGYKNDGYPKSSVLYGQTAVHFIESYESERDAIEDHPELIDQDQEISYGCAFMDQSLKSVDHLPDEPDY